jgi:uncharacterized membrane protein YeaQ/YmgE (transglycosylase-associated protein family)
MDLVRALLTGGLVGWVATIVMSANKQMSLLGYVLVGVVGSTIGSRLAGAMGIAVHGSPAHWTVSVLGAALLIWLVRAVAGTRPLKPV